MGNILRAIVAFFGINDIQESIEDLREISSEEFENAGVDKETRDILFKSEEKCKEIRASIYKNLNKLSGIKKKIKDEEKINKEYGPVNMDNPIIAQAEKINELEKKIEEEKYRE